MHLLTLAIAVMAQAGTPAASGNIYSAPPAATYGPEYAPERPSTFGGSVGTQASPPTSISDQPQAFRGALEFARPSSAGGLSDQDNRVGDPSRVAPAQYSAAAERPSPAQQLAKYCRLSSADLGNTTEQSERAVTLLELISQVPGTGDRLRVVQQYWNLAAATGRYRFAIQEERSLAALRSSGQTQDGSYLYAEQVAASARLQRVELQIMEARQQLGRLIPSSDADELLWPADSPLVGPYQTHFESLFARQPAPLRLKQIDRTLPIIEAQVEYDAEAVVAYEQARDAIPSTQLSRWLDMDGKLREQRRKFLTSLLTYNQRIAEYSMSVTNPGLPADTLVSTLIRPTKKIGLTPVQPSVAARNRLSPAAARNAGAQGSPTRGGARSR